MRDARFEGGVAGVGDYAELGSRPGAVQLPGNLGWAEHVVAAVDDDRRDVADATKVVQQLVVRPHEASVQEVVALDPGESGGVIRLLNEATVLGSGCRWMVEPSQADQILAATIMTLRSALVSRL